MVSSTPIRGGRSPEGKGAMSRRRVPPKKVEASASTRALRRVAAWYISRVYGRTEGPGTLPFYCDPVHVGHFAVDADDLASGKDDALFKLFVALAMFQARRDVLIMEQQRAMSLRQTRLLSSASLLQRRVRLAKCELLASAALFDAGCDVAKAAGIVDCSRHTGAACHVKDATLLLRRMGDSGKLPTSAWLHFWQSRSAGLLEEVCKGESDPQRRADLLVTQFSRVHRVGRKLASMFVSALSTPALAPGLAPWFPRVDGLGLVVVDTHVARAVDALRPHEKRTTYEARVSWLREQSKAVDLQQFRPELPNRAPRLVQQALYAFGSKSNRLRRGDECALRSTPCSACVVALCPFMRGRAV